MLSLLKTKIPCRSKSLKKASTPAVTPTYHVGFAQGSPGAFSTKHPGAQYFCQRPACMLSSTVMSHLKNWAPGSLTSGSFQELEQSCPWLRYQN